MKLSGRCCTQSTQPAPVFLHLIESHLSVPFSFNDIGDVSCAFFTLETIHVTIAVTSAEGCVRLEFELLDRGDTATSLKKCAQKLTEIFGAIGFEGVRDSNT